MVLWQQCRILDAILDLESNLGGPPNVIARVGVEQTKSTEETVFLCLTQLVCLRAD